MQGGVFQDKVIYKELSYQIIGILFNVYNELGYGHSEKYYYKAINKELLLLGMYLQKITLCNLITAYQIWFYKKL
jgi:hypothetical protein